MKKLTLVLLVVASLILGAMAFASCDASDLPIDLPFLKCDHEFVEEVTKAATCTEEGAKKLTCSKCDEVVEEVIPALGHDFAAKFTTDVAATCAAEGSKSKHCSRCDAVTEVTVIAKADHTWAETYTVDVAKTCTENGSKSKHCTECDAIDEESIVIDYSSGHVLDLAFTVDTAKTCTTAGWESIHCQNCDYTEQGKKIPASHNWDENYTMDVPFGCTTDGSESIHCLDCTVTKNSRVVAAHHVFSDEVVVTKAATLYSDGEKTSTCSKCSAPMTEAVKATIQVLDGSLGATAYADAKIGKVETDGIEWVNKYSLASMVTDTQKYYPTAEDPDGNAALYEISILANESMDYTKTTSKSYFIMRVQKNATKTNLGSVDFIGDSFDDACGSWITGDTQTGYDGPTKVVNDVVKQAATRIENGWHRFGFKLRQVVIAKDAQGAEIALTAGQPTGDAVVTEIVYKWIFEYYIDGVLDRTGYFEGLAKGNNEAGIWDAGNLLYTATISEDGKSIVYEDNKDAEVYLRFSMQNAFKSGSTIRTAFADYSCTIGDEFVQKVTPVVVDFNGGKPVNNYKLDGSEYLFPNFCHYQVVGGDANPVFAATKTGYQFDGWDADGKAIYSVPSGAHDHTPLAGTEVINYATSIFASGSRTYTCEICSESITEEIAKLQPTIAVSANNRGDGNSAAGGTYFDLYSQEGYYLTATQELRVEFSFLYNKSFTELDDGADTLLNFRPFNNNSYKVASLNVATGNFAVKNCLEADSSKGISAPSVMLTQGWHRLAFIVREVVTFDATDTPTYLIMIRLYVDGEMINEEGTWAVMEATSNSSWFTATKEGETVTYAGYGDHRFKNLARWGDFWRTNTNKVVHKGFTMFDDLIYGSSDIIKSEAYNDLFTTKVTPLDSERGYYVDGGNKIVFDLDGGAWDTLTYEGTKVGTLEEEYAVSAETYTADNIVWFQIKGAKALLDPEPKKDGFTFAGWEAAVVDSDAKTVTYKAKWAETHEHDFKIKTVVATLFTDGLKQNVCSECGWVIDEEVLAQKAPSKVVTVENHGSSSTNMDLFKQSGWCDQNEDYMIEFSFFYNSTLASEAANNGDVEINFRPFKNNGTNKAAAALNIKTGNIWVKGTEPEDLANGISASPDIMLVEGWHRIGLQYREVVTFDAENKPVYYLKVRLYVDGVLMNPTGTWSLIKLAGVEGYDADAKAWYTWYTATKNAETGEVTYTHSSAQSMDNMARLGDFWRTNNDKVNYYGFTMFDDIQFYYAKQADNDAATCYADLFKVGVTPLDPVLGTYPYVKDGNKVVFDLNGGSYPEVTVKGYKLDTKANNYAQIETTYKAPFNVWFQVDGAYDYAAQHNPTREGYTFAGWDAGTVDATKKTVTYKAVWVEKVFAYTTIEEWTAHEGMTVSYEITAPGGGTQKVQSALPGETANYSKNNEAVLHIANCNSADFNQDVANRPVTLSANPNYIVVTAKIKSQKGKNNTVNDVAIRVKNGSDNYDVLFTGYKSDDCKLYTIADKANGTKTVIGDSTAQWYDVTVIIDVAKGQYIYYVNGAFFGVVEADVPTTVTEVSIFVGHSDRSGRTRIGNFGLYVG